MHPLVRADLLASLEFPLVAENLHDNVLAGDVDLQHISTNLQTADIFTKALRADKLWQFMTDLGLTIPNLPSLRGSTEDTTQ